MELRSFNVQRVYKECVKVAIQDTLGVNKDKLDIHKKDIESMVSQLPDSTPLNLCHVRVDGEQWTPYLQVVKMIVLLGIHLGLLDSEKPITPISIIKHIRK